VNKATSTSSRKINISLDEKLLRYIEELAVRDFANRSDIIRQAIVEYIRKSENKVQISERTENLPTESSEESVMKLSEEALDKLRQEFSYVRPDDIELLQFLAYYKNQRSEYGYEPGGDAGQG
jgi:Arc/MetJ-type ribon-helix-helix transcriptional regulator